MFETRFGLVDKDNVNIVWVHLIDQQISIDNWQSIEHVQLQYYIFELKLYITSHSIYWIQLNTTEKYKNLNIWIWILKINLAIQVKFHHSTDTAIDFNWSNNKQYIYNFFIDS